MVKIGFSTSTAWYSKAIRWATGSKASHAFIVFDSKDLGCPAVLEAAHSGLRVISLENWLKIPGTEPVAAFVLPEEVVSQAALAAAVSAGQREMLGDSYWFAGLLGMSWVELGNKLRRKWRNPFRSETEVFCSEFCVEVLDRAGAKGLLLMPSSASPADLYDWCSATCGGKDAGF